MTLLNEVIKMMS